VEQRFISGTREPTGVTVHGGHIYWANSKTLGEAELGGAGVRERFIMGARQPFGVAVSG
jgi:hypothetical protein